MANQTNLVIDELGWSESRSINIGDYESRSVLVSIKCRNVNGDAILPIHKSAKITLTDTDDIHTAYKKLRRTVKAELDAEERRIRKWAIGVGNVDFYHKDKMPRAKE